MKVKKSVLLYSFFVLLVIFVLLAPTFAHAQVPEWGMNVPDNPTPPTAQAIIDYLGLDASEKNIYICYQPIADWYDYWVYVSDKESPGIIYRPSSSGDRGWSLRPLANTSGSRQTYYVAYNKNRPNGFENPNTYQFWYDGIWWSPNPERLATSYTFFPIYTNTVAYLDVDGEEETDNYAFVSQEFIDNLPDTSLEDLLNSSIFGNGQITGHAKPPENIEDTTTTTNTTDGFLQKIFNRLGKIGNDINGYLDNFLGNLETFFTPFLQSINKGIGEVVSFLREIKDKFTYFIEPFDADLIYDEVKEFPFFSVVDVYYTDFETIKTTFSSVSVPQQLGFRLDFSDVDIFGNPEPFTLSFDWYLEYKTAVNVFIGFIYSLSLVVIVLKELPDIISGHN